VTTWKPRKKAAKRQKVFTIGLAVLTSLCGIVAGYWSGYKHSKIHHLENTLSELENREPRDFDLPAPPSMMLREIRNYPK
jgi:hypothetical protein